MPQTGLLHNLKISDAIFGSFKDLKLILAVIVFLGFVTSLKTYNEMENKAINYEEMKKLVETNVLIIDVREPKEIQETGLIGKSINVPLSQLTATLSKPNAVFRNQFGRDLPAGHTLIVFTCRSGKRAAQAVTLAEPMGFKNCKYYKGGWLEWSAKQKEAS